jgi:type VI secretion system protein ImpA
MFSSSCLPLDTTERSLWGIDMALDNIALLPDISESAPAGENLELDPDFGALERASRGKPEQQYGDTIIPAEPADWKQAEALGVALQERTRDLRVMTHLAIARLNLSGIPAFTEMLAQIRLQIEERWDHVHPQLDPEDDNDPTLRANALFRLQDPSNVLRPMRDLALATSPQTGPIRLRDIAIFRGTAEPEEGKDKPSEALIRGAFSRTNPERLQLLREAVNLAVVEVGKLPNAFDAHAGSGNAPDFTNLRKMLLDIQKELKFFEVAADEPPAEEAAAEADDGQGGDSETSAPAARRGGGRGGMNIRSVSSVTTRDDALYLLELASSYFRSYEPSSPLPMLIDRARRLSAMDFMDILRDLAPDGVTQAQIVAGPSADGS